MVHWRKRGETAMKWPFKKKHAIYPRCKDCRWSSEKISPHGSMSCTHPSTAGIIALTSPRGGVLSSCFEERMYRGACGMKGKLFEPKGDCDGEAE